MQQAADVAVAEALATKAALNAVRGGSLSLPEACDYSQLPTIAMVTWSRAQAVLQDLSLHSPNVGMRIKSANLCAQNSQSMIELLTRPQDSKAPPQAMAAVMQPSAAALPGAPAQNILTREEAVEELQRRRQLQLQGAR
jgi:hypothetical protein